MKGERLETGQALDEVRGRPRPTTPSATSASSGIGSWWVGERLGEFPSSEQLPLYLKFTVSLVPINHFR